MGGSLWWVLGMPGFQNFATKETDGCHVKEHNWSWVPLCKIVHQDGLPKVRQSLANVDAHRSSMIPSGGGSHIPELHRASALPRGSSIPGMPGRSFLKAP